MLDRRIIQLYDEYTHAPLPRRVFLDRLITLAGGAAAAYALLPLLENNYAMAQKVAADDPALSSRKMSYPGPKGEVTAYLSLPASAGTGSLPSVIVIHENRGLNAHIEDVARRFAKEGFAALAPDLLSPLGGTPQDPDQARELIGKLDAADTVGNLQGAINWLRAQPSSNGKAGVAGFCWGGGMVNALAVAEPGLDAGVVFYGRSPEMADVAKIEAPLLLHYAGLDERINQTVPGFTAALDRQKKRYEMHMYENVDHAFHNDTNTARYNEMAAMLAWRRTVEFLKRELAA